MKGQWYEPSRAAGDVWVLFHADKLAFKETQ